MLHVVCVLHLANFRMSLYVLKMHFLPLQKVNDFLGTPPHLNAAGALAWTGFEPMISAILVHAVLYQLSYQANSVTLVTLWVRNIPVDGEDKWINEIYIWTAEKDMKTWLIIYGYHYKLATWQLAVFSCQFLNQLYQSSSVTEATWHQPVLIRKF